MGEVKMGLKRILDKIEAKDEIKYPGLIPEDCSYGDLLEALEKAKQGLLAAQTRANGQEGK